MALAERVLLEPRCLCTCTEDISLPGALTLQLGTPHHRRTLCKLVWKLEVGGYNLRFTELTNRNTEIDRNVREAKDYTELLPKELQGSPPVLEPRIVPDPDNEDYGMELGEASTVWCMVEGKWCLGTVIGGRKRKVVVQVDDAEHDFDPKDLNG